MKNLPIIICLYLYSFQIHGQEQEIDLNILNVGKWYIEYIIVDNQKLLTPSKLIQEVWIIYHENGKFEMMDFGKKISGQWEYDKNRNTISTIYENGYEEQTIELLKETELLLSSENNGEMEKIGFKLIDDSKIQSYSNIEENQMLESASLIKRDNFQLKYPEDWSIKRDMKAGGVQIISIETNMKYAIGSMTITSLNKVVDLEYLISLNLRAYKENPEVENLTILPIENDFFNNYKSKSSKYSYSVNGFRHEGIVHAIVSNECSFSIFLLEALNKNSNHNGFLIMEETFKIN